MKRQRGRPQPQGESYLPATPQLSSSRTQRDWDASFTSAQFELPSFESLDEELAPAMEKVKNVLAEESKVLDEEGNKQEQELNALKSRPSDRETLESQRKDLEADLDKFQGFVAQLQDANSVTARALEGKEKELAAKVTEIRRTKGENEELKKRVEAQGINMRDAERMKRELLAVEREISEAEGSRSSWEEKSWDLDSVSLAKSTRN